MRGAALLRGAMGLLVSAVAPAQASEALQPFQLVRSLQTIQDRIAAGDHAALPMQAKLLEMTDERMRTASAETFQEPKNLRALLVYGMSGGNPVTVEAASSRVELDTRYQAITQGIVAYLNGRPAAAIRALEPVDPMQLTPDLGAFLALVKGSLLAADHPVEALALLDRARLLSPGTLVEEAALRRSVALAAAQGDAARFALASTQYVERYLHSPYASQFADAFVAGVIAMHEAISEEKLDDITSMMDAEREKVIYLRVARRAAIDGYAALSAFAAAKARQGRDGHSNEDDPRTLLYSSLSTVTSATAEDVRAKLDKIDRSRLTESDQSLLDAVRTVVDEVVAAPPALTAPPMPVRKPSPVKAWQDSPADDETQAAAAAETDLPPVEGIAEEGPVASASGPSAASPTPAPNMDAAPPGEVSAEQASAESDPTDTAIADARRKLEAIDQMLGVSPE